MKHRILFIFLLIGFVFQSHGQLSNESLLIKKEVPEVYAKVKESAVEKWTKAGNTNHEMVVYTINNQAEAFLKMGEIAKNLEEGSEKYRILASAFAKWTKNGLTNYEMVLYTYENQLENLDY